MTENKALNEAMKKGMRYLAAGVSIVSVTENELNHAMTATSVTSLSDNPASLLVCVNRQHRIHSAFQIGGVFAVNVLAQQHQQLSSVCADSNRYSERFDADCWQYSAGLAPAIEDALVVFQCECDQAHTYGTHDIIIGRILSVSVTPKSTEPLIYFNGSYSKVYS